jgi:hypothetical protein
MKIQTVILLSLMLGGCALPPAKDKDLVVGKYETEPRKQFSPDIKGLKIKFNPRISEKDYYIRTIVYSEDNRTSTTHDWRVASNVYDKVTTGSVYVYTGVDAPLSRQ